MVACLFRRVVLVGSSVLLLSYCDAENTVEPPEDVTKFHPVRMLPAVAKFAGPDARLIGFEARYVRSDGSMDLSADYNPRLEYQFVRPRSGPADQPIGAGGGKTHEILKVAVRNPGWQHITRREDGVTKSYSEYHKGMERSVRRKADAAAMERVAPEPACELQALWKVALSGTGAPAEAVAVIEYDRQGYRFTINDLKIRRSFGHDCAMIVARSWKEKQDERKKLQEKLRAGAITPEEYTKATRALSRGR